LVLNQLFPSNRMEMLFAAVIFSVHPLHTEVVANIKSRDEILSLSFILLCILALLQLLRSENIVWAFLVLLSVLMAFLSKESAITGFGIFALVLWFRAAEVSKRTIVVSSVAIVSGLVGLVLLRLYLFSDGVLVTNDGELMKKGVYHYDVFLGNPLIDVTDPIQRFGNALVLMFRYLKHFFIPYPLVHDYGYNQVKVSLLTSPLLWFSIIVSILLAVFTFWKTATHKIVGFGLAFFIISISIYLNLIAITPDMYAERFMFAPSVGLSIVSGAFIGKVQSNVTLKAIGLVLLCIVLFGITFNRNFAWKNNDTLFEADMPRLNNCVRGLYNFALHNHGRYYTAPESEKEKYKTLTLNNYERVLEISDRLFLVYMDLGGAYMEFGYPDKAKATFEKAVERFPHLSIPYVQLGKYYMTLGHFEKAADQLAIAIEKGEENSDFYYLLAVCQIKNGNVELADETLSKGQKFGVSSESYFELQARLKNELKVKHFE